ncbi:MAG: helix-turn-helix domain-containing protein [Lentisphaerae bacterium]|nr:helix-turn-helix domain-containing protein [Lentisphaerota bacterium]
MEYFNDLAYSFFAHHGEQDVYGDGFQRDYGIQFIASGKIALTIGNRQELFRQGPIAFLTTPRYRYRYYTPGGKTRDHYYVCFNGPRVDSWIRGGLFRIDLDNPFIPVPNPVLLADRFTVLLDMLQEMRFSRAVVCTEMLLLDLLENEKTPKIQNRYHSALDELLDNVSRCPEKHWDFDKEAGRLSISRNYLNRLIRDRYHISPVSYLLKCRMERAAQMLAFGTENIAEIAHAVGIDNPFYFSRLFTRQFSVSPSDYRRNCRKDSPQRS